MTTESKKISGWQRATIERAAKSTLLYGRVVVINHNAALVFTYTGPLRIYPTQDNAIAIAGPGFADRYDGAWEILLP